MEKKASVKGFLHYRDDIGEGVRTGVVFSGCPGRCDGNCISYPALKLERHLLLTARELVELLKAEDHDYVSRKVQVTLMGHDPTLHCDFCAELLKLLEAEGFQTDLYSCLLGGREAILVLAPYVHLFTFTLPSLDKRRFHTLTRFSFDTALDALRTADERKIPYRLRFPILPGEHWDPDSIRIFSSFFRSCKSVILDFSRSGLSPEEIERFRQPFFKRGIVLY